MQKTPEKYDARALQKKKIEFGLGESNDIKVGEFWWYFDGMNIGNEISKDDAFKRVCMVLHTNMDNGLVLIVPITSKHYSESIKHRVRITNFYKYRLKTPSLILNQIKLIDQKRFSHKLTEHKIDSNFVEKIIRLFTNIIHKKNSS